MAKEDISLRDEMERLEIAPMKLNTSKSDENPFLRHSKRSFQKRSPVRNTTCCCPVKNSVNNGICKRKHNKLIKEPVLHILKTCITKKIDIKEENQQEVSTTSSINTDSLNLCTLVKTCNQLKISNDNNHVKIKDANDKTKWWKNEVICQRESREQRPSNQAGSTGSCSQQALNPQCDITIDELASYFETLVHIPKKMSSMAEMMYI